MSMTSTSSQVMKKWGGECLLEFGGCGKGCALLSATTSHYRRPSFGSFYNSSETVLLCNRTSSLQHLIYDPPTLDD